MRFVIRADAYRISGAGHVMRSSVIAEELIDRGYEVYFVGNLDEIPWVRDYISNLGFKEIFKPEEQFPTNQITDTLILDSYNISITDPFIQLKNWKKILVLVDDMTPPYKGDLYIHAGPETSWTKPKSQPTSIFLYGLEYLLIRKSLRKLKDTIVEDNNREIKILISAGGSDPFAFSQNLVKLLSKSFSIFHAYVLAPSFELPSDDSRFEIIQLGKDYEKLLSVIDFVFTTAGTSSWEYHFLGIPVALASAVENQDCNYLHQTSKGIAWDLGYRDLEGKWQLNGTLFNSLLPEITSIKFKANRASEVPDGEGANRILNFLI
jgi:UDP-2,4-diacetamido-2,4,6-trideoxy-beta-L-altropyranose hydrolase